MTRDRVQKPYPIYDQNGWKIRDTHWGHTYQQYKTYIREYTPSPLGASMEELYMLQLIFGFS